MNINPRDRLQVVLVRPRFPENIGMCSRACGNMGISRLALVNPELWPLEEKRGAENPYLKAALSLATRAGHEVIERVQIFSSLEQALADSTLSIGATARTGGWRQGIVNPEQAMGLASSHILEGGKVSLVFGPEDKGLDNSSIELCSYLVAIPTASEPSLNLAQAVLILLYELSRVMPFAKEDQPPRPGRVKHSPPISLEQQELLLSKLKGAMLALESLPADNSSYFMLPIRRLITRSQIRHNEFSMLMGICNKIMYLANIKS